MTSSLAANVAPRGSAIEGELAVKPIGAMSVNSAGNRDFYVKFGNSNITSDFAPKFKAVEKRALDVFTERVE